MPTATDQQFQVFMDTRVRPRAEQARAFFNALADDHAAIDDVYAAAVQQTPTWHDNRTDGPPRLLAVQDLLVYNAVNALLSKVIAGTATLQDIADIHSNWAVFQSACVRPVGS